MSQARRFAFITPNYHPVTCGVGDFSMRLAQELKRRDLETMIFTHTPAERHPSGADVAVDGAPGPTPMAIAARLFPRIDAFAPTDLVIQYTPQMLGASRFGSPATLWLAERARAKGLKVVVVAHELFLPWGRRPDLAAGAFLLRAQLAILMKRSDRVFVTMETRLSEIAPLVRLVHIDHPASVLRIGAAALPVPRTREPSRLRLGVFSTLASTKRFDVVLDAFALVHARHPHAELVLLGDIGDDTQPRVRDLRAAIARHPARDQIRAPGKLSLEGVAAEVASMDIYLFPMISGANTRTSTLPIALGSGVPSIATRHYETDDLFVDGKNIVFAEALTGEAFGKAALRLIDDQALAETVAVGGRSLYEKHLSWPRIADQFLRHIEETSSRG